MSRAHIHGFDSNAGQFARAGNPWDGDPVLKGQARKARRKAGIRPCRPGLPRRPDRSSRTESEAFEALQEKRAIEKLVASYRGNGRAVKMNEKSPMLAKMQPFTREVAHPARTELTGWQQFERQVVRVHQRAEVAKRCREAEAMDERARLEGIIKAAQAKLAELAS